MITNGSLRPLELGDIEPLSGEDGSFVQSRFFETKWNEQINQAKPSLLKALYHTYGKRILLSAIIYFIIMILHLTTPILLNLLIRFLVSPTSSSIYLGVFFAFSLFFISILKVVLDCQYFYVLGRTDVRLKVALKSFIYKKMLKLSNESRKLNTGGNISNFISIDSHTIGRWIYVINDTWEIPLLILLSVLFSFYFIGWPTFAGFAVMVIFTPIATYIAKWISYQTDQVLLAKDERAKSMNEMLKAIRVIKSCALEENFQKKIEMLRSIEYRQLIYLSLLETLQFSVINSIPILSCLITFSLYGLFEGALSSANAFTALALLQKMKETISKIPHYVSSTTKGLVSIGRIEKFLQLEEIKGQQIEKSNDSNIISISNGTFKWDKNQENPTLKDINIQVKKGELISIIGEVGSGKSSLICSIFGELEKIQGKVCVNGDISYCSQEPWILNSTLRENILCGSDYNEKKYNEIIKVCALEQDIQILPGGDLTEIGERGINLSGGQKWRVSLARACYQNSDIYLLDSPLSAVDAHVGKVLFNECINGYLKDKTRILVTHSLNYLQGSNQILIIENGQIIESGTYSHLISKSNKFQHLMKNISKEKDEKIEKIQPLDEKQINEYKSTLTEKEEKQKGYIQSSVIFEYYLGYSIPIIIIILFTGFFFQLIKVSTDSWISIWTAQMIQPDPGVWFYISFYFLFTVCGILSGILLSFFILIGSIISSNKLHSKMFHSIIHAPISFFDTTPLGRIMNRFSKDQHSLDVHLSNDSLNAFLNILNIIGILCVITYVTPFFLFVVLPVGFFYYIWQSFYRECSREISRLKSITLSPIYNHVSGSANGITSIRAYNFQGLFMERNENNVNVQGSVEFTSALLARWLALRLEFTACLVILFASIFAVVSGNINPSLAGLSVTYSLSLTYIFNWFIKVITMLEQDLVCAERIIEYQNINQEKPFHIEEEKPKNWPTKGRIEFRNVKMKYRDHLPFALNDISFEIKGGEKIGVVGRTGAGKSSIALTLFRIFELTDGKIEIDHIDISKIGLHDLRKNLCLIPQDPIIFSTTIRQNLDPFDEFSDYQIWNALEKLKMKKFIETFPKQLNDHLLEDGSNLSVGQKQLICLCRGILKNAKIIVLDEATSNIDMEYDEIIQKAIHDLFKQSTVITIAHRLNTILDYDKVMVVDKGKIVEYNSPKALSKDENSFFTKLLESSNLKL